MVRAEGARGARVLKGGWRGGAHRACGRKVGAPGDEEVKAVELAEVSRIHEGREALLQTHGDGGTRAVRAGLAEAAGSEGKGEWDLRLAR